ncbi:hypothetical protein CHINAEXTREME_08275 [Halobiforma lacisalsi AJ5]|uniref:Uncharacterized protein n=1 Tax=Natronobacterium lacisalsi AJ5 TaxID=358396 RepID=M0LZD7_NATLA|nr:hypothetical protein [Halobiforma lacisalsi]APW97773.1 hypothetical protein CHINAEXTREME_08275 [Halobiforma lacisalsi AJ5]EMA37480.1 hypothetical protein C445_01296 [Halobiforma lacisalsi AJ5]
MVDGGIEAGTLVLTGIAAVVLLGTAAWYWGRSAPFGELEAVLESRLTETLPAGRGTHLERPPRVRRIDVLDRDEHGERSVAVAPVVQVDLETTDTPGMELVFDYVAAVLEAIHPELEDHEAPVARYDVEFSVGPDGLLVDGERRRVTVPPAFADRLLEEETYRAFDLRRELERNDEANGTATVWGEPRQ